MQKQNKDLQNIKMERDSLQPTLQEIDANYWGFKAKKDNLSIEHSKFQRDYKNMEETPLKQQKEVEELRVDNANAYEANNENTMASWVEVCTNGHKFEEVVGL